QRFERRQRHASPKPAEEPPAAQARVTLSGDIIVGVLILLHAACSSFPTRETSAKFAKTPRSAKKIKRIVSVCPWRNLAPLANLARLLRSRRLQIPLAHAPLLERGGFDHAGEQGGEAAILRLQALDDPVDRLHVVILQSAAERVGEHF